MSIISITRGGGAIPEWTPADRIRKAREWAGLSQGEVAKLTDLSPRTIWMLEAGKREPKTYEYITIASATKVDDVWLKTGKSGPDGPPPGDGLPDLDSNQEPSGSFSRGNIVQFTQKKSDSISDRKAA